MKRLAILVALILGLTLASVMMAEDSNTPATEEAAPVAVPAPEAGEVSDADISYALGFLIGNDLKGQGIQVTDDTQFMSGTSGGLGKAEPRMDPIEIQAAMAAFAGKMRAAILANKQKGQEYLAVNGAKEGVKTTETGLQIKAIKEGAGDTPKEGDVVTVNYEGKLIDGTVFDKSEPGTPLIWDPTMFGVIPGWMEGLLLMKEGGSYELTVPSDLAYGDRQNGEIPGGSTLIFTMELVDTQTPMPEAPAADPMPPPAVE